MTVAGRVTIGIPTFNRSLLSLRAIRSALAQTYADVEVLVSDDASSDGTADRIEEISDSRLVFYRQSTRLGLIGNFDFCLRNATGEFFLLLGDDDVLLPTAIEGLVEPFRNPPAELNPESIGLVWSPCHVVDADGTPRWTTAAGPEFEPPLALVTGIWRGNRGPRLSSILVRTSDAIAVGGYQSRHGYICDMGNYCSVALLRDHVVCTGEPLVQFTSHHGSTTSKSDVRQWMNWTRTAHSDLMARARSRGDVRVERQLAAGKTDFLGSVALSILLQTIGKPGWLRNACREGLRSPEVLLTPYVCKRLMKDGWKLLKLRNSNQARRAGSAAA
jgi:glycosyltransferase involved in cell wall biosynthesis